MKSLFVVLWLAIIALIVLLGSCENPKDVKVYKICLTEVVDTIMVYDTVTTALYVGYIHPSGDYKWTEKGWLALKPFFKLSEDSTRLIQVK